jgi:hypothetical protein
MFNQTTTVSALVPICLFEYYFRIRLSEIHQNDSGLSMTAGSNKTAKISGLTND